MPGSARQITLRNLRNTRDLRAGILSLAAELAALPSKQGRLTVVDPAISEATIHREWESLLPAIAPDVRARMALTVDGMGESATAGALPLEKPNFRFEVLRLLLGASLEADGPQPAAGITAHIEGTQSGLIKSLGASPTPIRSALVALRDAGLIQSLTWLEIEPEALSIDLLSRLKRSLERRLQGFHRHRRIQARSGQRG